MGEFFNVILIQPVTNLFAIFYFLTGQSFVFGIILITLLIKILVYPLYKRQLESSFKLKELQPRIEKLRAKYKDNPVKLQEQTMALYKEINYNPIGCFASVIVQLPIVITLYTVIKKIAGGESVGLYSFVKDLFNLDGDVAVKLTEFGIDFGVSTSSIVSEVGLWAQKALPYVIGVVLVVLVQFASSYISTRMSVARNKKQKPEKNKKKKEEEVVDPMAQMNSPAFLLINSGFMAIVFGNFAWGVPFGLSVYWIAQSAFSIIQQFIVNYHLTKKKKPQNKK